MWHEKKIRQYETRARLLIYVFSLAMLVCEQGDVLCAYYVEFEIFDA